MMYWNLFVNELRLQWFELCQYWFEAVSAMILMLGMFVGLFFGVKSIMPGMEDDASLDGLLFGFLLWSYASAAYSSVTDSIISDTQKGYSEQLFICRVGFAKLMLIRTLSSLVTGCVYLLITAVCAMLFTGNWIEINYITMLLLFTLAAPAMIGLGFIVSGFALLYKKVETLGAMLTIAFMGLVALDGLPFNLWTLLPFVPGASLARDVILAQQALNITHLTIATANSIFYLTVGLAIFNVFEKKAKQRNLIGRY